MINNGVCTLRTCFRFPGRSPFPPLQRSFTFRRRFLVTASQRKKKEKVIVISGPTGSGKSRLALELAKSLNGEIVSADSVQVYRGLDVGSAKPSPDERKEVPHHLVDILHPSEDYSVGQFFEDARQATRCILDNGRVPIVVGGTGLYLRWFIYGKPDVPKSSSVIASEVNQELAELQRNEDWDTAVQLVVKAGDPKAQFLAVNDWYRLRRSLEIVKSSGSPPSAFRVPYDSFREQGECSVADDSELSDINTYGDGMEETSSSELDYEFMCFFLSSHRLNLYRSIDYRCEDMLLGMGFCPRLSGFLIRVFIQTPILQLKQLVTDKPWSTYKDAESKGVRVLLQSFTNSCLNFKKHHVFPAGCSTQTFERFLAAMHRDVMLDQLLLLASSHASISYL
ncbi:tRNA dimethylallyltransferase 9 isoform X4 [Vigna angularis]|uniref:tRNA dimethylallyltransferase 9 isoform X4 n=1 Tax=Phaseolus angularis TaxID=3914 RepID=UPI0022B593F6|nr:tRNA dimethylallyltransferase 9 isoform X4 [Vigna angularis]